MRQTNENFYEFNKQISLSIYLSLSAAADNLEKLTSPITKNLLNPGASSLPFPSTPFPSKKKFPHSCHCIPNPGQTKKKSNSALPARPTTDRARNIDLRHIDNPPSVLVTLTPQQQLTAGHKARVPQLNFGCEACFASPSLPGAPPRQRTASLLLLLVKPSSSSSKSAPVAVRFSDRGDC